MKFEQALTEIKNIDWRQFDGNEYTWDKKYSKYSLIAFKGLQKLIHLLKELGYQEKEILRPANEFKPKDFFIPNDQLFTEQEQQEVDDVMAGVEFDESYALSILQWAKMCDKGYDITKGHEDLYDELLLAIQQGVVIIYRKGFLNIGSISAPRSYWPYGYYSRDDVTYYDAEIEKISKEIEEEKAKGSRYSTIACKGLKKLFDSLKKLGCEKK